MSTQILATKLYIPPSRSQVVLRPRLVEQLNEGLGRKLTLVSAPAGFGKTTLVSEWCAGQDAPGALVRTKVAWLSVDEADNDPTRFLIYLIAALQTLPLSKAERSAPTIGAGVLAALQTPQPPPTEAILTALLNEIATIADNFVLVLDDYHVIDSKPIDHSLTFLLEHMPMQMHLVIVTREDPRLPLARLRAGSELTELRASDLRFTPTEATEFLNRVMALNLDAQDIAALETRTEGWIAGLQLASLAVRGQLSGQGQQDTTNFIKSFTGSHQFVMDYLVEQVLLQQPERIQSFLLRTSILDRMCGPLCDSVTLDASASGQQTLEYLEHANLFIVPLDSERYWYRYHHLFADLLRQRLRQQQSHSRGAGSSTSDDARRSITNATTAQRGIAELHIRASEWYENNSLLLEAFQHAAAANDVGRAGRLIEGDGIPRHFRGALAIVLDWLGSLPTTVLNSTPSLLSTYAVLLLITGQTTGVEDKLDTAEAALQGVALDDKTRNIIGQIATARATLALTRYQIETIIVQSHRALEYLHPTNLSFRASAMWTLGFAYQQQGERAAASRTYTEAAGVSRASGDTFSIILNTIGLGQVQESENQLYLAAETFRRVLQVAGDQPLLIIYEAHLGLARILYEWNDLDAAEQHGEQGLLLAQQYDSVIDRFILSELMLARLKLARGDVSGAAAMLAKTAQTALQKNFVYRLPEIAAAQVLLLLEQGNVSGAAQLAQTHDLPISRARVLLAQGDASAALAVLEPLHQYAETKGWADERLKVMVLEAVALYAHGEEDKAVQLVSHALALAEPGGFIRLFVDEGRPMAQLLSKAAALGNSPDYVAKLMAVFKPAEYKSQDKSILPLAQALDEPLSRRELQVLQLLSQGLSNREISERLFLSLNTVKGHNQKIFAKLQVQRRTEAIARARKLGLL